MGYLFVDAHCVLCTGHAAGKRLRVSTKFLQKLLVVDGRYFVGVHKPVPLHPTFVGRLVIDRDDSRCTKGWRNVAVCSSCNAANTTAHAEDARLAELATVRGAADLERAEAVRDAPPVDPGPDASDGRKKRFRKEFEDVGRKEKNKRLATFSEALHAYALKIQQEHLHSRGISPSEFLFTDANGDEYSLKFEDPENAMSANTLSPKHMRDEAERKKLELVIRAMSKTATSRESYRQQAKVSKYTSVQFDSGAF